MTRPDPTHIRFAGLWFMPNGNVVTKLSEIVFKETKYDKEKGIWVFENYHRALPSGARPMAVSYV